MSATGPGVGRANEGVNREKKVRKKKRVVIIADVLVFMIDSKRKVVCGLDT